ncbi:hypothetical protein PMZ80_002455 [Knufia obscura]|uniref:Uncharacterized protein n=1 Tax=Knufia obscura TaxID=1635080 RepID=A0ABR0RXC8_9EURO|nr:hypothetical protein PMZ80_002455 [Knufia obscura]
MGLSVLVTELSTVHDDVVVPTSSELVRLEPLAVRVVVDVGTTDVGMMELDGVVSEFCVADLDLVRIVASGSSAKTSVASTVLVFSVEVVRLDVVEKLEDSWELVNEDVELDEVDRLVSTAEDDVKDAFVSHGQM